MNKPFIGFNQKLSSQDDREYFVTSDLHFWHKGVLNFCPNTRKWSDVEEMNQGLIDHWNSVVGVNDVIFSLGDFCFKAKESTQQIISQLNGNIVWVRGNHCYKVFNQLRLPTYDYLEVKFDNTKVCMMHYPLSSWNQQGRGSVQLFGHVHGSYEGAGRQVDVGWDNWGRILTLKEAVDHCLDKDIYCPDHHKIV